MAQINIDTGSRIVIEPYDIEAIGAQGGGHIAVAVLGYWSADPISIYVQRGWRDGGEWTFSVTHSSGGRDKKEVVDDLDAEEHFAWGMLAATRKAKELRALCAEPLERAYQARCALLEAKAQEQRAAKEAREAADPAMGEARANEAVKQLIAGTQTFGRGEGALLAFHRGSDRDVIAITSSLTPSGRVTLRDGHTHHVLTRAQAVELLSKMSARPGSCIPLRDAQRPTTASV